MDKSQFAVGQSVECADGVRTPYIPVGATGQIIELRREEACVQFPRARVRLPYFSLKPASTPSWTTERGQPK